MDGAEGVVRDNLIREGKKVNLGEVAKELTTQVYRSGLEGSALIKAIRGLKGELEGLRLRADELGDIDLSKIHDAKISTTNNINYKTDSTPTIKYRKAKARAYKQIVENKSDISVDVNGTKYGIPEINKELGKYYDDIERLEMLDGKRVRGGKLGKYSAQIAGNIAGGAVGGAVGGLTGAAIGTVVGGETSSFLKGKSMAGTFGKGTGKDVISNAILERAKAEGKLPPEVNLKIPDLKVGVPKDIPKTKEIFKLERDIEKNVEQQKAAIKAGNFELVAALKEIYQVLVRYLKDVINEIRKNSEGGFIRINDSGASMPANQPKRGISKSSESLSDNTILNDAKQALREAKGLSASDIMSKHPDINLKRDVPITDIHGNKAVIPEGEALTPYELKGNKANCHSLFPDQLLTLLHEMTTKHLVRQENEEYTLDPSVPNRWKKLHADWQENLDRAYTSLSTIMNLIHLPHCLDYEWWFTHGGREQVAELLLYRNPLPVPNTVAFLGSPLFGAFAAALLPESQVCILDKSRATLDAIRDGVDADRVRLVHYDAQQPLPQELIGIADMVFFDPPWYVDYYDLFLRRSMQLAFGHYATVAFVLFPLLTRPDSLQERKHILEIAMSYGLSIVAMESHVAHYYTPQFEQESLREKGINAKNWRRGDFAIFISDGTRLPENIAQRVEESEWREALIGKIKVKVRVKDETPNVYVAPELLKFAERDVIFPSVSRRDPLRNEINLWTSTQRGFKIKGWMAVWKIVEGIENDLSLEEILESIRRVYPAATVPDSAKQDVESVWRQLRGHLERGNT